MPLGLTVGDSSTCYATFRKERHQVGSVKGMTVNPCRKTGDTFEKLKSNALANPYVDPGQYDLRKPGPRGMGTGGPNSTMRSSSQNTGAFKYSGSQKLVRKSEFEHMHNGPAPKADDWRKTGFISTGGKNPKHFTNLNTIGYSEEPYEHAQDD